MPPTHPQGIKCPDDGCGREFRDLYTFFKHWRRHKEQCPYPSCRTPAGSKWNFERHWMREHAKSSERSRRTDPCNRCGKLFSRADVSNRKRHEKTCNGRGTKSDRRGIGQPQTTESAGDSSTHAVVVNRVEVSKGPSTGSDVNVPSAEVAPTKQSWPIAHSWPMERSKPLVRYPRLNGERGVLDRHVSLKTVSAVHGYATWREDRALSEAIEKLENLLRPSNGDAMAAFISLRERLDQLKFSLEGNPARDRPSPPPPLPSRMARTTVGKVQDPISILAEAAEHISGQTERDPIIIPDNITLHERRETSSLGDQPDPGYAFEEDDNTGYGDIDGQIIRPSRPSESFVGISEVV